MIRQILGGALGAFLIVSDRIALVALAIAAIAVVKIVASAQAPDAASPRAIVHIQNAKPYPCVSPCWGAGEHVRQPGTDVDSGH